MPFMKKVNGKSVRDYKAELEWEHTKAKHRVKDRTARNAARRKLGLKVGDPRHADHIKELTKGGSNGKKNLRAVSAHTNLQKEALRKKREAK